MGSSSYNTQRKVLVGVTLVALATMLFYVAHTPPPTEIEYVDRQIPILERSQHPIPGIRFDHTAAAKLERIRDNNIEGQITLYSRGDLVGIHQVKGNIGKEVAADGSIQYVYWFTPDGEYMQWPDTYLFVSEAIQPGLAE